MEIRKFWNWQKRGEKYYSPDCDENETKKIKFKVCPPRWIEFEQDSLFLNILLGLHTKIFSIFANKKLKTYKKTSIFKDRKL